MQKILREPLFHFLMIGLSLFLLYSFLNPEADQIENNVIKIDDSDVQRLVKSYEKSWNATPDSATLKNLIADEVKSEVFYREALRMQLDHNDEIIRRRLKQKYEFLVKDLVNNEQPSESALNTFYESHKELYKESGKLTFTQIYLSPDNRQNPLQDARDLQDKINASSANIINEKITGDPFHLQRYHQELDEFAVRQLFGKEFTNQIFKTKEVGWTEPIRSGYGIHLIKIESIKNEAILPFEHVKDRVAVDWKSDQLKAYNDQLYENLLQAYKVEYDLEKWEVQ